MSRRVPDRVPLSLWGHTFSSQVLDGYDWQNGSTDGKKLAQGHLEFLDKFGDSIDLLKVTPFYKYMSSSWGSRYLAIDNEESIETLDVAVKEPRDWLKLRVLDPISDLGEDLKAVSILSRTIGSRMPFVYTIASPFVQALSHVSTLERVLLDMESHEDELRRGLETIAETCVDFGRACLDAGATGIFYAIGSTPYFWRDLSMGTLEKYMFHYDEIVLKGLEEAEMTILHVCSSQGNDPQASGLMESGWLGRYQVDAINWWNDNFTPIEKARKVYGDRFCLAAGLDHARLLRYGTPKQVESQVKKTIEESGPGGGFIISPGCNLALDTPFENLVAVRDAVMKFGNCGS